MTTVVHSDTISRRARFLLLLARTHRTHADGERCGFAHMLLPDDPQATEHLTELRSLSERSQDANEVENFALELALNGAPS